MRSLSSLAGPSWLNDEGHNAGLYEGEIPLVFIIGGDETCIMASETGDVKVIGSVDIKKHEKKTDDSR